LIAVDETISFVAAIFMQCSVLWIVTDIVKKKEVTAFKAAVTSLMFFIIFKT